MLINIPSIRWRNPFSSTYCWTFWLTPFSAISFCLYKSSFDMVLEAQFLIIKWKKHQNKYKVNWTLLVRDNNTSSEHYFVKSTSLKENFSLNPMIRLKFTWEAQISTGQSPVLIINFSDFIQKINCFLCQCLNQAKIKSWNCLTLLTF